MPEEKPELPSRQEVLTQDEQTVPPEVETGKRPFAGEIIHKIKFHQKKILIGLALFLGVLAVAGVANRAYWLGRWWFRPGPFPTPTPIEAPTPTLDPTADWETYTNLEYGYLIKYPEEATLKEPDPEIPYYLEITGVDFKAIIRVEESEESPYYLDQEASEETHLGGIAAKLYKFPEGYCDIGQCTPPFVAVVAYKDSGQYALEFFGEVEPSEIARLMLSTFKFLTPEEKQISFRIDKEGDITKVILISIGGEEKVLREYQWPDSGPARGLYPSLNNKYLAISQGTAHLGSLEIINLENEETVDTLSEYGKVIWLDEYRLVLNAPEKVDPERPYEGGEGFSLATFDAASSEYRLLKQADEETDYPLLRIENEEIFFEKRVAKESNDWTNPKITQWKINFEGTIEMEVK